MRPLRVKVPKPRIERDASASALGCAFRRRSRAQWGVSSWNNYRQRKQVLIFTLLFLAHSGAYAADLQAASTIELSNPSDVGDAQNLNNAVDAISNKVMECVKNKRAKPDECYCLYPKELEQLKTAYENTLRLHPAWQDQVIFWRRDNYSYNLSLKGLGPQLYEKKCPTRPSGRTR